MKNIYRKELPYSWLAIFLLSLCFCRLTFATQPIVIEGAVPNEATKQEILSKLYATYGQVNIIDKIQVGSVSAPNNWSTTVSHIINEDLKSVRQGKLAIKGTQVSLVGKVSQPDDIQRTSNKIQSLLPSTYRLNAQLSVNAAEQQMIDATLKNRIIEFESGSAVLARSGTQILDEMVVALHKVSGKKVKVIGHTDSSGDTTKNLALSQARAVAVKNYLISKAISVDVLSAEGLGATQPVADNATVEGRKKNRRIEFEVL